MTTTKHIIYQTTLFVGAICLLLSCRPKGVLSSGQMEDLFVDMHRAEGIIYVRGFMNSHDSVVSLTYDSILTAHGVTRAQLDSSLVWYTNNPMMFNKIYPHVMERLQKMKDDEQRAHEEELRRETEDIRHREENKKKTLPAPGRLLKNNIQK